MELRTKIPIQKEPHHLIDYHSDVLLLGSCFAESIGEKIAYFKFKNGINPLGILFHPLAVENLIERAINQDYYSENEVFELNEQWQCFDAHSSLNASTPDDLLTNLNKAIDSANSQIKKATHIVITLGTAWAYRHIAKDKIVANCHKVPQKAFLKELFSVSEIEQALLSIIALVRTVNNNTTFIFTVSPVRHLKDGFVENSQSKAHLISAVHQVVEPRERIHYFPSFEILMDELRDYRFYSRDMIHPNQIAIDYIWKVFTEVWLNTSTFQIMKDVDDIQKGLLHRPFNESSEQHQEFLTLLALKKERLNQVFPHIAF